MPRKIRCDGCDREIDEEKAIAVPWEEKYQKKLDLLGDVVVTAGMTVKGILSGRSQAPSSRGGPRPEAATAARPTSEASGAASQALQNANLALGFDEGAGLR